MKKWYFVGLALYGISCGGYAGIDETVVRQHMVALGDYLSSNPENDGLIGVIKKCESTLKDTDHSCAHIYTSQDGTERIIELCNASDSFKEGLYIQVDRKSDFKYYPWFDKKFMRWVCSEIDAPDNAMYVAVRNGEGGPYDAVIYSYMINLSAGYYYVELKSDGTTKVLDEQSSDLD